MIRKIALLVIAMVVLLVAVSCGTSNEIEISGFGGQTITVNTDGLSAEQIDALQSAANGESDIKQLMQSGLFSLEEMRELGLMPNVGARAAKIGNGFSFGNMTMDDLNLDGLDDVQITAIQEVLDGERTVQSLIEDGILTMEEMEQIGLTGGMPATRKEGTVPKDRTTSKQTEQTQEIQST